MKENTKNRFGLWTHESKNGLKYANGKVVIGGKTYKIALFVNTKKTSEKSPDYSIIIQ